MQFHPATQILAWCLLVAAMQLSAQGVLLIVAGLVLLCAFAVSRRKFVQLVRRTKWIMLSLLLIYAWSTPGQPLPEALGMLAPTREGLADGVLQLTRLLAALAALAILLDRLHRQQLIAGLYALLAPLQWLGVPHERFAVRLALTLHYAETAVLHETHNWRDALRNLFEPHGEAVRHMELPLHRFGAGDALLMGFALLLSWGVLR